jgi:ATP-dependent helicase HrpA
VAAGKVVEDVGRVAASTVREAISAAARSAGVEVDDLQGWTMGDLPRTFEGVGAGGPVTGYPSLVEDGGRVNVRVLPSQVEQGRAMRSGTRRLLLASVSVPSTADLTDGWDTADRLALTRAPHGSLAALMYDCVGAAVDDIVVRSGGPAWDAAGFERLVAAVRHEVRPVTVDVLRLVARILASAREVEGAIKESTSMAALPALTDAREHLGRLVHAGFVTSAGRARLPDLQRYLRALLRRVEVVSVQPHRDAQHLWVVQETEAEWQRAVAAASPDSPARDALDDVRWMLEELRVSLFAQGIGTPKPVSPQRVRKAIAAAAT